MNIPNWLHGYAATEDGSTVRAALRAGRPVDLEDLGPAAYAYRDRWLQLQEDINHNRLPLLEQPQVVSRGLVDAAQADSVATGRVDLHDALVALTALPGGAGDFFHELLSPTPDRYILRRLSAPFHGSFRFEGDGMQSTATLHFEGGDSWPEALGGDWTSERLRSVTVNCRYAKWRDRRVRRLGRVQVVAKDVAPA